MFAGILIFGLFQFFLPMPIVHAIVSTGILFIILLNYFVIGVKLNPKQMVGVGVCFLEMLLVINGK